MKKKALQPTLSNLQNQIENQMEQLVPAHHNISSNAGSLYEPGGNTSISEESKSQKLSILKVIENQSDENLEEKVNRQVADEQFQRREVRRQANSQLRQTDQQLLQCFPKLSTDLREYAKNELENEMNSF